MSKSLVQTFATNLLRYLGWEYQLGEEGEHHVGYVATPTNPWDLDCSGLVYTSYFNTGIRWKTGGSWPRLTANGYRLNAVRVYDGAYRTGDVACFSNSSGHTYHITVLYRKDGEWWSEEARGERWGVKTYKLTDPVNGVLTRGAKVYRFPWVNLGEIAPDWPLLRITSQGPAVREAQLRLNAHLGYVLQGTATFGDLTLECAERFQALKGLEIDGEIGPLTEAELRKTPVFPELKYGSGGAHVRLMKWRLGRHGFGRDLDQNNPNFLNQTKAAVRAFQRAQSLTVDGVCGDKTWAEALKAKAGG